MKRAVFLFHTFLCKRRLVFLSLFYAAAARKVSIFFILRRFLSHAFSIQKSISNRSLFHNYLFAFLLGFGALLIVYLPAMCLEHGYFLYYGDYNSQQLPFYSLANDAVRSGSFGWNWYTDLGANFIGSYAFIS